MAVKLRLRRMGRTKRPLYAVVAADTRAPRDGKYIEDLGRYEPIKEPAEVALKEERILYWLQQGAQPSDTVRSLLSRQGLMLRLHLTRKGRSEDEIAQAVAAHRERIASKPGAMKKTKDQRRREALEAERERAAEERARLEKERKEREAELERQRKEAEEQARKEAEEQARKEAEEQARKEAEAQAAAKAEAEAAADTAAPEADAELASEAAVEAAEAGNTAEAEAQIQTVKGGGTSALAVEEDTVASSGDESQESTDTGISDADDANTKSGPEPAAGPEQAAAPTDEPLTAQAVPSDEVKTAGAPAVGPDANELATEVRKEAMSEATTEAPTAEGKEVATEGEAAPSAGEAETAAAAEKAEDDLTKVYGVGKVYAGALNEGGIFTFAQLAQAGLERLRTIISEGSSSSDAVANEETWAKQAGFLAAGDKEGFNAYVDELRAEK